MKKQYKIWFEYDEHSSGGEPENDSEYSHCSDVHIEYYIKRVTLSNPNSLLTDSCNIEFDPKSMIGKTVFVIVVRYSSGDTFHTSYGNGCVADICLDENDAKKICQSIRDGNFEKSDVYRPWIGYFEDLTSVDYKSFVLER